MNNYELSSIIICILKYLKVDNVKVFKKIPNKCLCYLINYRISNIDFYILEKLNISTFNYKLKKVLNSITEISNELYCYVTENEIVIWKFRSNFEIEVIQIISFCIESKLNVTSKFSNDTFCCGYDNGIIAIFSKDKNKNCYILKHKLEQTHRGIFSITYLENNLFVSGSSNGTVFVWNLDNDLGYTIINKIKYGIFAISNILRFNENTLCLGSYDGSITFSEFSENFNEIYEIQNFIHYDRSPIISLIKLTETKLCSCHYDFKLLIWNLNLDNFFELFKIIDDGSQNITKINENTFCYMTLEKNIKVYQKGKESYMLISTVKCNEQFIFNNDLFLINENRLFCILTNGDINFWIFNNT